MSLIGSEGGEREAGKPAFSFTDSESRQEYHGMGLVVNLKKVLDESFSKWHKGIRKRGKEPCHDLSESKSRESHD